jgi:hypothetical protein
MWRFAGIVVLRRRSSSSSARAVTPEVAGSSPVARAQHGSARWRHSVAAARRQRPGAGPAARYLLACTRGGFEQQCHRGRAVRELIVNTFVTLDGVMQARGGQEDPSGGFEHGGWSFGYGWRANADTLALGTRPAARGSGEPQERRGRRRSGRLAAPVDSSRCCAMTRNPGLVIGRPWAVVGEPHAEPDGVRRWPSSSPSSQASRPSPGR